MEYVFEGLHHGMGYKHILHLTVLVNGLYPISLYAIHTSTSSRHCMRSVTTPHHHYIGYILAPPRHYFISHVLLPHITIAWQKDARDG